MILQRFESVGMGIVLEIGQMVIVLVSISSYS